MAIYSKLQRNSYTLEEVRRSLIGRIQYFFKEGAILPSGVWQALQYGRRAHFRAQGLGRPSSSGPIFLQKTSVIDKIVMVRTV